MFTRRRFLAALIPGLAAVSGGVAYAGYRQGGCPLSSAGYCVGPCTALRDSDDDLICDRIASAVVLPVSDVAIAAQEEAPAQSVSGGVAQPKPTDLATGPLQPTAVSLPNTAQPQPTVAQVAPTMAPAKPLAPAAPPKRLVVDCPFGLVNDAYPGRCRRYVDRNGNGICDLSEPTEG